MGTRYKQLQAEERMTISFFGPAYNAQKADGLLGFLQNREAIDGVQAKLNAVLKLQNHVADPVGTIIGGNPATEGTIPDGSTTMGEMIRAATGKPDTSHNCYGSFDPQGNCGSFWRNGGSKSVPINKLQNSQGVKKWMP